MAETAHGTAGRTTRTALARPVNADLGVRPFRLLDWGFTGEPEFGSSGQHAEPSSKRGEQIPGARRSWGGEHLRPAASFLR